MISDKTVLCDLSRIHTAHTNTHTLRRKRATERKRCRYTDRITDIVKDNDRESIIERAGDR